MNESNGLNIVLPKAKCKRCNYEWEVRVANPKSCPRCKQYLKQNQEVN